jgi:RNA polymerase sigma-70 factor, ECF subfamily
MGASLAESAQESQMSEPRSEPEEVRPSTSDEDRPLNDLLGRVAGGDRRSFEEIYSLMAGRAYGIIVQVLRDHAQAEEVAQEVFIEVWRTAPRFDRTRGSARTWVLNMAHRRAIDRVRSVQASRQREDKFIQPTTDYDNVVENVESRLETEQLRDCLDNLSGVQRESIMLAFFESHPYPVVAEMLSVPLGTIKSRMRDGLSRLRDCLGVLW